MLKCRLIAILATLCTLGLTEMDADGLWTGHDWYNDENSIGVRNGVPYSKDFKINKRGLYVAADGDADDYMKKFNVKYVKLIMTKDKWEELFPIRNPVYTYDSFLHAVGKFPYFCGDPLAGRGNQ